MYQSASMDDMANILYTSGTTGDSKGVMLTYGQYDAALRANDEVVPVSEKDRVINFLPFTHIFERGWAYLCLSEGAQLFINTYPHEIQESMRQGKMMPTTFELISEGRKLADELGVELCGILLGDNVDDIAPELGNYGADKVYVYNSPLLKDYTTDAYTKVISEAVEEIKPEILLFGASNIGRDLAPRCAARLHTGLCADCTHLDIDVANYIQFLRESSTLDVDAQKWDMEDRNLKSKICINLSRNKFIIEFFTVICFNRFYWIIIYI